MALVVTIAQSGAATQEKIPLKLTVSNTGTKPEKFCMYHTPFEGVRNAFMAVTDSHGKEVDYRGMMAKRAAPDASDYRTVKPGETLHSTFDLRDGYPLAPGHYTLRFAGSSISGLPASANITLDVK